MALLQPTIQRGALSVNTQVEVEEEKEGYADAENISNLADGEEKEEEEEEEPADDNHDDFATDAEEAEVSAGVLISVDAPEVVPVPPKVKAHTHLLHLAARHRLPTLTAALLAEDADVALKVRAGAGMEQRMLGPGGVLARMYNIKEPRRDVILTPSEICRISQALYKLNEKHRYKCVFSRGASARA